MPMATGACASTTSSRLRSRSAASRAGLLAGLALAQRFFQGRAVVVVGAIGNTSYQHLAAAPGRHQKEAVNLGHLVVRVELPGLARLKHAPVKGQ